MRARISRKLRWIVSEPVLILPSGSGRRKGMGREFPSGASRAGAWAGSRALVPVEPVGAAGALCCEGGPGGVGVLGHSPLCEPL